MTTYVLRRLGALAALLVALSGLLFVLRRFSSGDPVRALVGANASQDAVARARADLGLDQPLTVQYGHYLAGLVRGDLGTSYRTRRPVGEDIATFGPPTLELVAAAFVVALVLALLFAVSSILRWPGAVVFRGALQVGAAAPTFLLAIGGIVLFSATLGWLPSGGRGAPGDPADQAVHLLLPALALGIAPALALGRVLRSSLLTTLAADHVRTARAKGLGEAATLRRHVLRNSAGPALSMAGLQLGFMLAGVLVVENVFTWNGLGSYLASSIPVDDYPAIAGVTLVLGATYVVVNAVVDVLQALADPRTSA